MDVAPFSISVSQADLDDLAARLRSTRWPDAETVDDWSQGIPLAYLQDVCRYWADEYNWRAREAEINRFPQFRTLVNGLDIHFLHARSPHPDAFPIVLTHGWPGSFAEFLKVVDRLTEPTRYGGSPEDAFHVVCPSLPGFGFSAKPTRSGWIREIVPAWAALMAEIGYERYGAQGGDWGSFVTTALACYDTEHCVGIHLNFVFEAMQAAVSANPKDSHTPEQQRAIAAAKRFQASDSAYFAQQATRPQTVGYGLTDSPAFQAAWILQGFWAATDCDGHPENAVTRDEMLDDIMIYWLNAAGASSARIYWENPVANFAHGPVAAPTAVAVFPKEICPPVRAWCERALPNIRQWTEMPRGGHFAALEQPALFADDLGTFFAALR